MEIQKWQTKSIYALAGSLGMVEHGSHEDSLHDLCEDVSGVRSVTELTKAQADMLLMQLRERMRMRMQNRTAPLTRKRPARKKPETPGGVTSAQQNKAWALMYELAKYDVKKTDASIGMRLCGIIKRQFGMDAAPAQPFRFLSYQQGHELIEILKQYVDTAALRACRREATR